MEVIAEIRRRHLISKESIGSIARDLKLSRPTARKHLQTVSEAVYIRQNQPPPRLRTFQVRLANWLELAGNRTTSSQNPATHCAPPAHLKARFALWP